MLAFCFVGGSAAYGWSVRKSPDLEEPLIAAVWNLKVGEYTKPIQGSRGWYVFKLADRKGAAFTFLGCEAAIAKELARRRIDALLDQLKAAAKPDLEPFTWEPARIRFAAPKVRHGIAQGD